MIHELKILPKYFKDVKSGKKTFEIRKNDRPFAVGDYLALNEYDPNVGDKQSNGYSGRFLIAKIKYLMSDKEYCKGDYVILGIEVCEITKKPTLTITDQGVCWN